MSAIIQVKNRTNWLLTFITSLALILLLFIIIIIIPLGSIEKTYLLFILSYTMKVIPFTVFFMLFLYLWLWNTLGKTLLHIEPDSITITYKNKLFTKPRTFLKQEVEKVQTVDCRIEKNKMGVRYHFSFTGATYSVVLFNKNEEKKIINWITEKEADDIADKIKQIWCTSP